MAYICLSPEDYDGQVVDNGQCVRFVQVASNAPKADHWAPGADVKGNLLLLKGTAIATFVDGKYQNNPTGNHAAIYVRQDDNAIYVYDQWASKNKETGEVTYQPVHFRPIKFKVKANTSASNDGNAYSVIEPKSS